MITYQNAIEFVKSKSDDDLKSISKTEIYVYLKLIKDEMTRRRTPRQRGKHKPTATVLPIPVDMYEGARRLALEWIRRTNKKGE